MNEENENRYSFLKENIVDFLKNTIKKKVLIDESKSYQEESSDISNQILVILLSNKLIYLNNLRISSKIMKL